LRFPHARNFISESLLVVGQLRITKRQAFGFAVNNWCKMERRWKIEVNPGVKINKRKSLNVFCR
jgi:hypothetical protein